MAFLYTKKKSFALATNSIKNFSIAPTLVSHGFVSWVGEQTPPGEIVKKNIKSWRSEQII